MTLYDLISLIKIRYFGLEELLLKGGEQRTETRVRVNAGGTLFETTRATLTGFSLHRNWFRIELHIERSAKLSFGKSSGARGTGAFLGCLSKGEFKRFMDLSGVAPGFWGSLMLLALFTLLRCWYCWRCWLFMVLTGVAPSGFWGSLMLPTLWCT